MSSVVPNWRLFWPETLVCTLTPPRMRMWVNPNAQASKQTNKQTKRASTLHFTYIVIYTVWNLFDELLHLNGSITFVFLLPRNQKSSIFSVSKQASREKFDRITLTYAIWDTLIPNTHIRTHARMHTNPNAILSHQFKLKQPFSAFIYLLFLSLSNKRSHYHICALSLSAQC